MILLSSTMICSRITSPQAGAPTMPVPTPSVSGSHLPTFRGSHSDLSLYLSMPFDYQFFTTLAIMKKHVMKLTNTIIVRTTATMSSYSAVFSSENDPTEYFHINQILAIYLYNLLLFSSFNFCLLFFHLLDCPVQL